MRSPNPPSPCPSACKVTAFYIRSRGLYTQKSTNLNLFFSSTAPKSHFSSVEYTRGLFFSFGLLPKTHHLRRSEPVGMLLRYPFQESTPHLFNTLSRIQLDDLDLHTPPALMLGSPRLKTLKYQDPSRPICKYGQIEDF